MANGRKINNNQKLININDTTVYLSYGQIKKTSGQIHITLLMDSYIPLHNIKLTFNGATLLSVGGGLLKKHGFKTDVGKSTQFNTFSLSNTTIPRTQGFETLAVFTFTDPSSDKICLSSESVFSNIPCPNGICQESKLKIKLPDDTSPSDNGCVCVADGGVDCNGICGGKLINDECGICGGTGIPIGECDCNGNTLDYCGTCGGKIRDEQELGSCGCDGNPLNNFCDCDYSTMDDCGICGGPGAIYGDKQCCEYELDRCGVCNGNNQCRQPSRNIISKRKIKPIPTKLNRLYHKQQNRINKSVEIAIPIKGSLKKGQYNTEQVDISKIRKWYIRNNPHISKISDDVIIKQLYEVDINDRFKYVMSGIIPLDKEVVNRSRITDCYLGSGNTQWSDSNGISHYGPGTGPWPYGPMFISDVDSGYCCDAILAADPTLTCSILTEWGYNCHGNSCNGGCGLGCSWGGIHNDIGQQLLQDNHCCYGCEYDSLCPEVSDSIEVNFSGGGDGRDEYLQYIMGGTDIISFCSMFTHCAEGLEETTDNFECGFHGGTWDGSQCECIHQVYGINMVNLCVEYIYEASTYMSSNCYQNCVPGDCFYPEPNYDCDGNWCQEEGDIVGCDGLCNSDLEFDECGVCDGPGAIYGCSPQYPDNCYGPCCEHELDTCGFCPESPVFGNPSICEEPDNGNNINPWNACFECQPGDCPIWCIRERKENYNPEYQKGGKLSEKEKLIQDILKLQ